VHLHPPPPLRWLLRPSQIYAVHLGTIERWAPGSLPSRLREDLAKGPPIDWRVELRVDDAVRYSVSPCPACRVACLTGSDVA
jgi:hypothetical protein